MKNNGKILLFGVCFLMAVPLFSQNVFLELNLKSPPVRKMIQSSHSGQELEMFRVIERAGNDRKISGIILNISSYEAGRHAFWELRNSLEKFKSKGKKVITFISSADLDMYCLATVADKIVMDETGTLILPGYAWGRGYVQHSLEKLGVGVRELRYLEYKTAAETYTRDSLSDADRIQYGEVLDDIMKITRDTVIKARFMNEEQFDSTLDEFLFSSKRAIDLGLVDRLGRKEAVLDAVKEISAGREKGTFVIWGNQDSSITESKSFYGPGRVRGLVPVIAVVNANGISDMETGIAARKTAKLIKELSEHWRTKAIVLRISSPGGSAEAADYIAEAVKSAGKKIPVVVSMGSVAASGGYWASMSASRIIASPVTITGSIGVIGSWFYDSGLNNKLGLSADFLQRGEHADLMSGVILPHRDLNEEEINRYQNYILDLYKVFITKVAENRNIEIERVELLAEGRVYSGLSAFNFGLIDGIGGLDDALKIAREFANIPKNRKIAYSEYPKPRFIDKMLDRMLSGQVSDAKAAIAAGITTDTLSAAAFAFDLFLSTQLLEDLRFRITHNGQVMPILPLDNDCLF